MMVLKKSMTCDYIAFVCFIIITKAEHSSQGMEIFKSMACAYIAYVSLVIFLSHRLNIGMEISWIMEHISICINSEYFPKVLDNGTYLCLHKF